MKKSVLSVEDAFNNDVESTLNRLYLRSTRITELPFPFHSVAGIEKAIEELKTHGGRYGLVLSSEFLPGNDDAEVVSMPEDFFDSRDKQPRVAFLDCFHGKTVGEVLSEKGDVLRLADYCREHIPNLKVIIISPYLTKTRYDVAKYLGHPNILEYFGRGSSEKRLKRLIERELGWPRRP